MFDGGSTPGPREAVREAAIRAAVWKPNRLDVVHYRGA